MTIEQLKNNFSDAAKDIKLNLSTVLSAESGELSATQITSVSLASAYATRNKLLITAMLQEASHLSASELHGAKAAAIIMAMNNVYYRFTHSVDDKSYETMPVKLRMNVMNTEGMDKILFELNCLAVSAINGCGKCMSAHAMQLEKNGVTKFAIQHAVRIAAVIHAAAMANEIN